MRRMAAEPAVWVLRVVGVEVEVMNGSCADGERLEAMGEAFQIIVQINEILNS